MRTVYVFSFAIMLVLNVINYSYALVEPKNGTATIVGDRQIVIYWDYEVRDKSIQFEIERMIVTENNNIMEDWNQIFTTKSTVSWWKKNCYIDSVSTSINNYSVFYRIRAIKVAANSIYTDNFKAEHLVYSDGFDYPAGDTDGEGSYICAANGDGCLKGEVCTKGWYVPYDVMEYTDHTGEDWNGLCGGETDRYQPIYAISKGRVVYSDYMPIDWGNIIVIAHKLPDGEIVYSQYAHLEEIYVQPGDYVERRQQIGTLGKGEKPYAAHLHFEIRKKALPIANWPGNAKIPDLYYDPSDKDDWWTDETGFIETHRSLINYCAYPLPINNIAITSSGGGFGESGKVNFTVHDDSGNAKSIISNIKSWSDQLIIISIPKEQYQYNTQPFFFEIFTNSNIKITQLTYPFNDVEPNQYFSSPVIKLWKEKIVNGYGGTCNFKPNAKIIFAELIKILTEISPDINEVKCQENDLPFPVSPQSIETFPHYSESSDKSGPWYCSYYKANQIRDWIEDFRNLDPASSRGWPGQKVQRKEVAFFLFKATKNNSYGSLSYSSNVSFSDVSDDNVFAPFIKYCAERDIFNGYPDGKFKPEQEINRAEIAKVFYAAFFK